MPCVPDLPKLIGGSNILAPENNHMKSDEKFDGLNFAISLFIYPRISLERKQIFWKFMNVSLRSQIVMVKNGNIMPKFPIGGGGSATWETSPKIPVFLYRSPNATVPKYIVLLDCSPLYAIR